MTEKSRIINQWCVYFEKGRDFDSWGQLVEAADEYSRCVYFEFYLKLMLNTLVCSVFIRQFPWLFYQKQFYHSFDMGSTLSVSFYLRDLLLSLLFFVFFVRLCKLTLHEFMLKSL